MDVLFVCTGNLCRSPSAAWFLAQRLLQNGPEDVTVESAGTLGASFDPPQRLLKEGVAFGMDLSGHVPRKVDTNSIHRADLVVGMAREHLREVVLDDPPSFAKTFTLREVVRRGTERGPRNPGEPLVEWLERINAGRRHLDMIGDSPQDDIPDPMGGSSEDFRQMLTEVEALTRSLYALVWGSYVTA